MTKAPWIRFFPSDWLSGTRGMSAAETGVYITLVMTMYEAGAPLRDDEERLARLCGLRPGEFRRVRAMLVEGGKIVVVDGGLWNERVAIELKYREEKSTAARGSAKRRWTKNDEETTEGGCDGTAESMRNGCYPEARVQIGSTPSQQQHYGESERRARTGADPDRSTRPMSRRRATTGSDPARSTTTDHVTTGADPAGERRADPATTGADPAGDQGAGKGERGAIEARLRQAAGLAGGAKRIKGVEAIEALLAEGFDLDRDVLPVVCAHPPSDERPIRSWAFYATICREERRAGAEGRAGWASEARLEDDLERARAAVRRAKEDGDDR